MTVYKIFLKHYLSTLFVIAFVALGLGFFLFQSQSSGYIKINKDELIIKKGGDALNYPSCSLER